MGWKKTLATIVLAMAAGGLLVRIFLSDPAAPSRTRPGAYRGNGTSKVLHRPGCRYYDPKKLPAEFASVEAAADAGFRACGLCIGSHPKGS